MKKIVIDDKHYNIDCSAYTYIQYKQVFKKGIFSDIQTIKNFFTKQAEIIIKLKTENENISEDDISDKIENELLFEIDDFVEAITRLAYIFIYTNDTNFMSYEDFMKGISRLSINDDWVIEVTEFAVEKFC